MYTMGIEFNKKKQKLNYDIDGNSIINVSIIIFF